MKEHLKMAQPHVDPRKACESYLQKNKRENIAQEIWPSENIVIDRLLLRTHEMASVYKELYEKLPERSWRVVLDVLVSTAAIWNLEAINDSRTARRNLDDLNKQISQQANNLAGLLRKRTALGNSSGFSSSAAYHIVDLIDQAAQRNGHYCGFLKDPLNSLAYQYDLKYWPNIASIIKALAIDSENAEVSATDPITASATSSRKGSKTDFFRAFFAMLDENRRSYHAFVPNNFHLSDEALANVANCALDLPEEDAVDAQYVKRMRQRLRDAA